MKKIIVAAGTSENKKNFAVDFIKQYLQSKSIAAEIVGINIYDLKPGEVAADVIVAIGPINFTTDTPVINGTAFITRMGMEAQCEKIIAAI